jgi:acylglycerol lipase
LFSDEPQWQTYVAADPLTLRRITIAAALADLDLGRYAVAAPEEIELPTLLVLAGRDRIIDNLRVRRFVERMGSRDRQIVEYPAGHTLEFEPDPQPFFDDLCGWAKRIAAGWGQR